MQIVEEYILKVQEERQKHLNLFEDCVERGGANTWRECRGILAYYLNTTVPSGGKIHCCHACHNGKCSNPKHLYWGTPRENTADKKENGRFTSPYDNTIKKHGLEKTKQILAKNGRKGGLTQKHWASSTIGRAASS